MPTEAQRRTGSFADRRGALGLALLAAVACGACAGPAAFAPPWSAADGGTSAPAAGEPAGAAAQAPSAHEPQYLRFRADETQLHAARDDGRHTYLEFGSPVATDLELSDEEGRPLASANAGRVAAIAGVHGGILVRSAGRASFVSPNPRALSMPRWPLPDTPDHGEARARLENQAGQQQAMQRAIEAARQAAAPGVGARRSQTFAPADVTQPPPRTVGQPPAQSPAQSLPRSPWQHFEPAAAPPERAQPVESSQLRLRRLQQMLRSFPTETSPGAGAPAASQVQAALPLAAANASASAPEQGLVRVYFATASRAIVAPDDGLALLLREARNADEIRVTGYTDASGSRAANDVLAVARASAVVQVLLRRGIPLGRIVSNAVGADDFIADNASDRGRALNRRVEVLLLSNGAPLAFGAASRQFR